MFSILLAALFGALVAATKPNIVFILTDDQDKHMDSLSYMKSVQKNLVQGGTSYEKHYCTTALCCPSRVSILTGKLAHNTNVTTLGPPYGGYPKFISQGLNEAYLPRWLQEAGYKTYYAGKLMNAHSKETYDKPYAKYWDGNDFLIDPWTYRYLNASFQKNHDKPRPMVGYTTDLLSQTSLDFLDEGHSSGSPFFLMIATVAPHGSSDVGQDDANHGELEGRPDSLLGPTDEGNVPLPAERYKDALPDVTIPYTYNYNPNVSSGASWVRNLPHQPAANVAYNNVYYRRRLQALLAVDDLVQDTFDRLEKHGILNNTYVIYSTDNGFHIGQHRLQAGKNCPYEEDINVPLVIRGPGIPASENSHSVSAHVDLVPTILGWAQAKELPPHLDGQAIAGTQSSRQLANDTDNSTTPAYDHSMVEHWGSANFAGLWGLNTTISKKELQDSTYKAVRVIGPGYNFYYSVWCNNEHELYDMTSDPGQMRNLLLDKCATGSTHTCTMPISIGSVNVTLSTLQTRLDTLLVVLKDCKGPSCINPWRAIHPSGGVNGLIDALSKKYDSTYNTTMHFEECTGGYLPWLEGPQFPGMAKIGRM